MTHRKWDHRCHMCGDKFQHFRRWNIKYCSPACKQRAWRIMQRTRKLERALGPNVKVNLLKQPRVASVIDITAS